MFRIKSAAVLFLLLFMGCGGEDPNAWPPTAGDYVKNVNGRGMAMSWGIIFDVEDSGGSKATSASTGNFENKAQADGEHELIIGSYTIELTVSPGNPINMKINGRDYGSVEVGDKVSIGKGKKVKVFGVERKPK